MLGAASQAQQRLDGYASSSVGMITISLIVPVSDEGVLNCGISGSVYSNTPSFSAFLNALWSFLNSFTISGDKREFHIRCSDSGLYAFVRRSDTGEIQDVRVEIRESH